MLGGRIKGLQHAVLAVKYYKMLTSAVMYESYSTADQHTVTKKCM